MGHETESEMMRDGAFVVIAILASIILIPAVLISLFLEDRDEKK